MLRSKWASQKELEAERVALISELEKSAAEGKTAEKQKLGETRAAVFAELEESLSPELARQLETAIDRRLTFVGPDGLANAHSELASELAWPELAGRDEHCMGESLVSISPVARGSSSPVGNCGQGGNFIFEP